MRELALKTYLIGQSSKLAQSGELKAYVEGEGSRKPLGEDFWKLIQHAPRIEETAPFASSEYAKTVFDGLPEDSLTQMAKIFSLHHNNCVHERIKQNPHWELKAFPAHGVEVGYMEGELKTCIQRHRHGLIAVAGDLEVVNHRHYKARDLKAEVPYDVFLATWTKTHQPRLIDGNHRAIHQVRQRAGGYFPAEELKIVVPSR